MEVVIIRVGELTVKRGLTRAEMERLLLRAAREAAEECGGAKFEKEPGRIYAYGDVNCLKKALSKVFGVKSVSPARVITYQKITDIALEAADLWSGIVAGKRFAVRVHRVGEHAFTSRDVAAEVGAVLVAAGGRVDLEDPELEFYIEIRGNRAYFYTEVIEGPGGLPLGSEGKILALVSAGIDSPVAAWMLMRRGAHVDVLYCNLGGTITLRHALEVIKRLLAWSYGYNARVIIADCGPVAMAMRRGVREELWNIAFKRALYRIGVEIAKRLGAIALATGESLGQVSSQTLQALAAVEAGIDMPILRPLIGMDKDEIVKHAQKIGTYELSAKLPEYCAVFSRRPRKWALREEVEAIDLALYDAITEVVNNAKIVRKRELDEFMKALTPPHDIEIDSAPEGAVIVDLRDEESYKKWHLPGAVRADVDGVLALVDKLGRDKTYVFYCYSGGLSLDVAESLRKLGIKAYSLRRTRNAVPPSSQGERGN
ncbi:tRNA uracil 4-sulfurtransferase ThiI [Pyrobaculum aerophilum]|uniref:tRNA sulfurtransferase n=1 Tax=Pyrobaculum aerophilum TaxID=13773 RepID=A0A371QZ14_9CREN|nr:tRNA uracil 4-sulfurtransferase ThiI [Pyrobaculum aerophilum]RFA96015.1 tRNA 4-thiouridine(8) synthase ThiI [Pyrobaculum aerophilum]RFA98445.1 tRNA 4-thiouridine(8) synthase ThiI [Pyrobaculum aerophilum]